jgi:hypothetical protein
LSEIKRAGFSIFDLVCPAKCLSQTINKSSFVQPDFEQWYIAQGGPSFSRRGDVLWRGKINIGGIKLPYALTVQITVMFLPCLVKTELLPSFRLSIFPLEILSCNVLNGILKDFDTALIDLPS